MPKVGDIVFAKTFDVYSEETSVSPAIVTRVFTEADGEWAKDREILGLTTFPHNGDSVHIDMDKGTADDNGDWIAGGWSESADGPGTTTQADPIATAQPESVPFPPSDSTPGSVGDATPQSLSGTSTETVGDGTDTAPANQPV